MSYIPNANDPTAPADTIDRSTAAAEFRALKTLLNSISTVASSATPDIFNTTGRLINYTGVVLATGFVASVVGGALSRYLMCAGAAQFTAGPNLLIDGVASGSTLTVPAGALVLVIAITTTQFRLIQLSSTLSSISNFTYYFQSADIPATYSTQPAVAHGLGAKPLLLTMVLKNTTAELGYSIGDEITITSYDAGTSTTTVVADAVNITISIGAGITINHKNSNTRASITAANWVFVVRAWK